MYRPLTMTAIGLAFAIAAVSCAQPGQVGTPETALSAVALPAKADNFRLVSADGRAHELYRLKDASAVVVMMHGVGSADVASAAPELARIKAEYAAKGVEVLMLNSNPGDKRDAILADAAKNGLTAPILQDDLQLVGEQIGATRVSETFILDPKSWKVAYRGPLSSAALDDVLAGKAVASADAKGALISFPARSPAAKAQFAQISYSDTIAPMIEEKCVACHQEGGIAPFAFSNYEQVKGMSAMIREAVRADRMPPWDPDPHVGKFKDDKSLSGEQIKTLIHWIEAGAPRGAGPDKLAAVKHVAPEWPLGKPDLILEIPAYKIPATGVVDYQYPVVPNPLTEGKWLKASTTVVGARQAVHHVLSGFVKDGEVRRGGGGTALGSSVGGYTVGMESVVNPAGMGTWVPTGGGFQFQMHYTPFGKEVTTQEKVGLYFYKDGEKPDLMMREMPLVDQFIELPPNDGNHKEVAYFDFPKDAILHTAVAHAHYRGTYSKLELRTPDGVQKTILNVPFYDFNWQRMYEFAEPIKIPAGSKVIATYVYDNSKRNPANPDPSQKIVWGDQSFEEMFYTSLRYRWADETAANQTNYDQLLQQTRLMGMMDDNIDGKLSKAELRGQFAQLAAGPGMYEMADADKDGFINQPELDKVLQMMRQMQRPAPAAAAPSAQAAPAAPKSGGQ